MSHASRIALTVLIGILGALVVGLVVAILTRLDGRSYSGAALAGVLSGGGAFLGIVTGADQLHLLD
ncbi:hypothetical protein [Spirillospora sp. CA-294931]|uniref:hypothetical protein n=1 Tax=Spirillospora sp. CA-294931 TaxID=3240042 RepID=UPI003D8BE328